jgi:hypothetical protein
MRPRIACSTRRKAILRRLGLPALASLLLAAALCASGQNALEDSLHTKYGQFLQAETPHRGESDAVRARRVMTAFNDAFGPAAQRYASLDETDLRILLSATLAAGVFSQDSVFPLRAATYARALTGRGEAVAVELRDIFTLMIKDRLFLDAARLRSEFAQDIPAQMPVIHDAATSPGRGVFALDDAGASFSRKKFNLPRDGILIIAQTRCHFTVDAAREIFGSPAFAAIFREHALWLAPAAQQLDVNQLAAWNSAFPAAKMVIADKESAFPEVRNWGTPTFLFFHHGRLAAVSEGWRRSGGLADIADGLRDIGIDPPPVPAQTMSTTAIPAAEAYVPAADQSVIDRATAPVRSGDDLAEYVRTADARSPLQYLGPTARRRFLAQLRFTADGARRPDLAALNGLTASQAYAILALFGWQSAVASVPGLRTETALDRQILAQWPAARDRPAG